MVKSRQTDGAVNGNGSDGVFLTSGQMNIMNRHNPVINPQIDWYFFNKARVIFSPATHGMMLEN